VQLTTDQDLILLGVAESAKSQVDEVLKAHGLQTDRPNALRQKALACVALPLCSLAITEAERVLPEFIAALEASLDRYGLSNRAPVFRMTGCGNGCARPYNAELALVGQGVDKYAIFAGGHPEGTRLAFQIAERVPKSEVAAKLDPLFARWATEGGNDSFGEFIHKLGAEAVKALLG
jgi:sulfite reductase beta subunit-like hemoprotein